MWSGPGNLKGEGGVAYEKEMQRRRGFMRCIFQYIKKRWAGTDLSQVLNTSNGIPRSTAQEEKNVLCFRLGGKGGQGIERYEAWRCGVSLQLVWRCLSTVDKYLITKEINCVSVETCIHSIAGKV